MRSAKKLNLLLGLALTYAVATRAADQPRVTNAKISTRSAASGLESQVRSIAQNQEGPAWIGYAVPIVPGDRTMCCCNVGRKGAVRGGCALEGDHGFNMNSNDSSGTDLEGPANLWILLRVSERKVGKIRTFSEDCELNAGGLPFIWLTDVKPAENVALLSSFVRNTEDEGREERNLSSGALAAIALTADPSADRALDGFIVPSNSEHLRQNVAFWMGEARGRHGFETLRRLLKNDSDDRFREHAIFGLNVSHEPEAIATLIDIAKHDPAAKVRGQALFWLAQKAGKRATQTITEAIDNDPETEVKKRAVFALSQLPHQQGVPLLIQVARTNRSREVRKQAMFWLGQSNDPRALSFFEQVLLR
ncbi:MAG TPA: HEAT repeat domain-containing protein [Terriglobia bacterium]|nr:HEAT repeat domain-containing protein [Terriglobia bacterium]